VLLAVRDLQARVAKLKQAGDGGGDLASLEAEPAGKPVRYLLPPVTRMLLMHTRVP
jgi:hypothetical protein